MITLNIKEKVISMYFNENMTQRAIAKELHISRTTIRKYIKQYESTLKQIDSPLNPTEKSILKSKLVEEPQYDVSSRKPSKLTPEIRSKINSMNYSS